MTRTYVSTLGFHETRVTRPVIGRGIGDEDRVVLVRPASERDDDRADDAVQYVEDMIGEIAPGATVSVSRIDPGGFVSAVTACGDLLREATGEVIVNFGGGAREVFLPLTVAVLLRPDQVDTALQYTDVDQEVREWPVPNVAATPGEPALETLRTLASAGRLSIPQLTSESEKSKSTVSRHVDELEREGLLETERSGKTKYVELTPSGELFLYARTT